MIPDSTFRLKWRRTYPDSDQAFRALDPDLKGHSVIQVSRNMDSVGNPTSWHWFLTMPIHVDADYWRVGGCKGDESTVREAAAAAEAAYFRFRDRLDEATIKREIQRMDDLERRLALPK